MKNHCTREICKLCFDIIRVGFWVPNKIWNLVAPRGFKSDSICLRCFTRIADEKSIQWDKKIKFYPVSFISHLEN